MPLEEKALLPVAIFQGTHRDLKVAYTFTSMCQLESGLKVRKWFPLVKPNMDCSGAHNDLLCQELYREGFITDSKHWKHSKQWLSWRKLFQQRPDIGTMVAAKAFSRLADKFGLDNAVQMWKTGKTGTVPGLNYLMQVRALREEMTQYRLTADHIRRKS